MLSELAAKALGSLSHKERTVAEMLAWLAGKGASGEESEATVAELIDAGALDDERFALRYAEDKRELAGWGDERITTALTERGVPGELIDAAIAAGDQSELERAVGVLEARGEAPDDDAARNRCFAALARRGYSAELAYEAVRRYGRIDEAA